MHVGIVSFSDVESALDLANILIEKGHKATIYLPFKRACYLVNSEENQVELFYKMKLLPRECQIRIIRFPRLRNPRSFKEVMQLRKTIRNDRLDIAHIMIGPLEIWSSVLVLLTRFIPIIVTIIIPKPNFGEEMPAWIEIAINRLSTFGKHLIIVNGEKMVDEMREVYHVPKDRVVYIPLMPRNYVKGHLDSPVNEEENTVLFIGRALPHKGLEYLIKAEPLISKEIPDVHFLISIHGDQVSYIEQVVGLIKDNPKFEIHKGFMTGETMANYFARSTVVTLPYLTASTSGVLLDAYSFGKPVVATSVGSLSEYVENGKTGLLIPPANVEELADAIIKILKERPLRTKMAANARKWIDDLLNENTEKLLDAYHKSINLYEMKK